MLLNLFQDFDQDPEISKCSCRTSEPLFCSGGGIHRQSLRLARRLNPRLGNTKGVFHALFEDRDPLRNPDLDPFVFFCPEVGDHPVHLFVCVGLGYDRFHLIFTPNTELDPVTIPRTREKASLNTLLARTTQEIRRIVFAPKVASLQIVSYLGTSLCVFPGEYSSNEAAFSDTVSFYVIRSLFRLKGPLQPERPP